MNSKISNQPVAGLDVKTVDGFLRLTLKCQDFQHKRYPFILARQMMAFGRYPSLVNGAVYMQNNIPQVFDISVFFGNIGPQILDKAAQLVSGAIADILDDLLDVLTNAIDTSVNVQLLNKLIALCKVLISDIQIILGGFTGPVGDLINNAFDTDSLSNADKSVANDHAKTFFTELFSLLETQLTTLPDDLKTKIEDKFSGILAGLNTTGFFENLFGNKEVVIPNEPWTPIIKEISLDYTALATTKDIQLIHLYPYHGTFKHEEITQKPALFPTFCDEGTLYLGLENLVPGNSLNILMQMAEATADSEAATQQVAWHYLDNNQWKLLRPGFEILEDATFDLTSSGVVKFALPQNMSVDHTIMPKDLHWIKASIPSNSQRVSEAIGIHTQAIKATFTNTKANDKSRLVHPIESGSIAKLLEADARITTVAQPFETFGGMVPEAEGPYYLRISELLRHKNRAIQKWDYERLVLQHFPEVFKTKCLNHNFPLNAHEYINDLPYAPGYVTVAVIPDLNKLKAGNSYEPKVPVSTLQKIQRFLKSKISPFVRLTAVNPWYEKVSICMKVKLLPGKDENYYKSLLREEIREFLAPWAVGVFEKLTFGQCINRSDLIGFLESRDYLDFILELKMALDPQSPEDQFEICPTTARSILVAGDIDICILSKECESWGSGECETEQLKIIEPTP